MSLVDVWIRLSSLMATAKAVTRRLGRGRWRPKALKCYQGAFTTVAATLLAACSLFPSATLETRVVSRARPDPKPYLIGKDDVLDVIVWKEAQLSGTVTVADDGTVTIPLIGGVPAAGLTCDRLRSELQERLSAFIRSPNVTVRVHRPDSRVYYILGEVHHPGIFPLHSGEFLSQGLAEAGGLSDFADADAIRIVRRSGDKEIEMTINFDRIRDGEDLKADIPLEAGDTITVP